MFPGACPLKFGQRGKIALKIGPDWGIFLRATKSGFWSLFRELPPTQDPGFLRPMSNSGNRFWRLTSKQPRDRVVGVWGTFFSKFFSRNFFTKFFLRNFSYFQSSFLVVTMYTYLYQSKTGKKTKKIQAPRGPAPYLQRGF